MENTKRLLEKLQGMGCKATFKPYQEAESGAILLQVRRPAEIVDGRLVPHSAHLGHDLERIVYVGS